MSQSDWPPSIDPCRGEPPVGSIGVVIPVRDGIPFFKLAIHSVLSFTDVPSKVIVVDNLSGLKMKRLLMSMSQNHGIDIVRYDEPFCFASEVNLGLRRAFAHPGVRHGIILNADAVVPPLWASSLLRVMESDPEIGAVGPVSNVATAHQTRTMSSGVMSVPYLSGFCMMIRREAFESVGGFDEGFLGGGYEDQDIGVRMRARGWKLKVACGVHVQHFWRCYRRSAENQASMNENRKRFIAKNGEENL